MGSTKPTGSRPTGASHAAAVAYMETYINTNASAEVKSDLLSHLAVCKDYYSEGGNIDTASDSFNVIDEWHSIVNDPEPVQYLDIIYLGIFGA